MLITHVLKLGILFSTTGPCTLDFSYSSEQHAQPQLLLSDVKVSCGWVENLSSDVYMEDENWVRYTVAASGEVVSKCTHHENGLTLI